ncbi:MAG: NAD(P)-binding protein [Magnetococcales bacterium]|nr:NAD(P)-binding protein [Magnetococcales bacterium]
MPDYPTNPFHSEAVNWDFENFSREEPETRQVAYGDASMKCPTYVTRTPPCQDSCPAGEDIRGINNLLRGVWPSDNPWEAAFRRLTKSNPFPAVMGRVCPAPCQGGCNRQYRDETVGINAVEHAIGQYAVEHKLAFDKPTAPKTGKRIAIVGSGPGGLSCAYHSVQKGHSVTIFERDPKLGGMMRYGIMGYRVDRDVMDAEIQRILDLGVEVKLNTQIGTDITLDQLRSDYDAVFLAVGAQVGRGIPIPGSEGTSNVTNAISFLREFELNGGPEGNVENLNLGKHVLVIGDGDVAMDVARLALRLGSKATLLSGVAREEMNCSAYEFDEALAEGTDMKFQTGSVEILRDGDKVTGIKCQKMVRKEKGEDGWNHAIPFFRYKAEEGSEFTIDTDMVVASIGQGTDMKGLESATNDSPFLKVDHNYQIVGMEDVFGGGDAVKIALLTTAIGHGRIAADSIDMFLNGIPLPRKSRADVVKYDKLKSDYFVETPQAKRKHVNPSIVKGSWDETLSLLTSDAAVGESKRCMSCGLCFECNQCMLFCPQDAIDKFKGNPEGEVMYTRYEVCVGCHICAEVCPTGYIDMGMGLA